MIYALVIDDTIANVIVWDGEDSLPVPEGYLVELPEGSPVGIG